MDRYFEFTVEDAEELQAVDIMLHGKDGSMEIHRLYENEDDPKQIVVDGGGTRQ